MAGLEVLPPKLAARQQPGWFGFSNSLSLENGSIINIFNWQSHSSWTSHMRDKMQALLMLQKVALSSGKDKALIPTPKSCTEGWKFCKKRTQWTISVQECNRSTVVLFPFTRKTSCVPVVSFWYFMMPLVSHGGVGPVGWKCSQYSISNPPDSLWLGLLTLEEKSLSFPNGCLEAFPARCSTWTPFPPQNKQGESWGTLLWSPSLTNQSLKFNFLTR